MPLGRQLSLLARSRVFMLANFMEILERLAYYGLRTVLPIYMVLAIEEGGPQFDHVQKGFVYGWWALVQSIVPAMTGGLADRYGYKRTVGIAIAFKTAGYIVMAYCVEGGAFLTDGASSTVPGHPAVLGVFMAGAMLLAFGTAVFKPGLQGMIAVSIPTGTKSVAWAVFYQLVNVGGFIGPFLAGIMRLLAWRYVFIACAAIVCLNYIVLFTFKEPEKSGKGFGDASIIRVLWESIIGVFQPRLFCFIVLFSGYWLMFFQLFDILPNFIADWVDASGPLQSVAAPLIQLFGGTVPTEWNGQLPQEYMINVNAGICMTLAFVAGYFTGKLRAVTAMAIGIGISCVAIYGLGVSQNGWFTLMAIGLFSLGEITASPKKAEYLSSLAPKGREGLYLGYVNVTQAIGWSIGSVIAGKLYETGGDKIVLARRMLVERFQRSAESVEAMQKTDVLPALSQALGSDTTGTVRLLWETYEPQGMWLTFAIIGVTSMLGLFLYGALTQRLKAEQEWIFGVVALAYTWAIYDGHSFTTVPTYTLIFAGAMLLYTQLRARAPHLLPEGAGED